MVSRRSVRWLASCAAVFFAPAVTLALDADRVVIDPPAVPVGGLVVVRVRDPEPSGTFDGQSLRFFHTAEESAALVGIDLDHPPGRFPIQVSTQGKGGVRKTIEVVAREFPVERLTVPPGYTALDARTLKRARREKRLLQDLWLHSDSRRYWEGRFVAPAVGEAGSPFGLRRIFNGEPRSAHAGIDIRAGMGAAVRAANRGRVVLARDLFLTGNTVVLDNGLGLFTVYVHLSEMSVRAGEIIEKGGGIGKVGATGRATGPHLHFAARIGDARVDPEALLDRTLE